MKVILAFHRHSLGIKDTVHLSFGQLSIFKSSNAYAYSFIGHGGGLQPLSMINFNFNFIQTNTNIGTLNTYIYISYKKKYKKDITVYKLTNTLLRLTHSICQKFLVYRSNISKIISEYFYLSYLVYNGTNFVYQNI